MSENTWEIMKGMELGDVELQMALQCAPVITGVKVSNLLNIELSGYRQMVEILKDSDICMYTLGATCGRVNVFIYNAAKLRAFVQSDDVQRLMSELGYADMELSEILAEFRGKYQQYLKKQRKIHLKTTGTGRSGLWRWSSWQGVVPTRDGLAAGIPARGCGGIYSAERKKCTLLRLLEGI